MSVSLKALHVCIVLIALLLSYQPCCAQQIADSVTKVYRIDRANVESLAAELSKAFKDDPSVRIAAETSTGRIVVVAPPDVHAQLDPLMKDTGGQLVQAAPSSPVQPQTPAPSQYTAGPGSRLLNLKNLSAIELRNNISKLYQGKAPSQKSGDGRSEVMMVGAGPRNTVRLQFDYATNKVAANGSEASVEAWDRLIRVLDNPSVTRDDSTALVSISGQRPKTIQRAMDLIELRAGDSRRKPTTKADIIQWSLDKTKQINPRNPATQLAQAPAGQQPPPAGTLPAQPPQPGEAPNQEGLLGPVQIEYLEGLDVIVLRGNKKDVDRVNAIIKEIEELSVVTEPSIEIVDLEHVDSEAMAEIVRPLHDDVLSVRQGRVSITPLVKPNSLLLLGREESVKLVVKLIRELDRPVEPNKQFHVFRLSNLSAADAETWITDFYEERGGLGTRLRVVSDYRSNSLIVQAGPRDAAEIRKLLAEIDVSKGTAVNEVRVFKLNNSLAEDLAPILEEALRGGGATNAGQGGGNGGGENSNKATALSLTTIDAKGQKKYQSGILADVEVNADTRTNSIVVRGPADSMELIEALIRQLDELPSEDAEIKVFTIENGDALLLADVLNNLFGTTTQGGGGNAGQNNNSIASNPLIPLRFSVDERTNSIVAAGSLADLRVVEAILLRLDDEDVRQRQSSVFRLRFAPAIDVSNAINQLLRSERDINQLAPTATTPFQQIEQEVVVVPEPVSNSLIVSATPRYYNQIIKVVEELDKRPPMVMIQVLIAEVNLSKFYEVGVELGIQDPLLFDRSAFGGGTGAVPGFGFNNQPLGGSNVGRGTVAAQGLGAFGLGRVNNQLGFGGLVLSASSDALSVLLRALEQDQRLQVLSRPQVMTLDNQEAFVQVGQRVPIVRGSTVTDGGNTQNTVEFENVGLLLRVVPRISPDGLVVMEINAENSSLGDVADGIPVSVSANGTPINSPIINTTLAQTTVSARSGQTVVLGGLITERDSVVERKVPYLGDIPLIGDLFRYDQDSDDRTELLIIMTPYIVRGDQDIDCINQIETERMSWCLSDVFRIHGCFNVTGCQEDGTYLGRNCYGDNCGPGANQFDQMGQFDSVEPQTFYPDQNPTAEELPHQNGGSIPQNDFSIPQNMPMNGGFQPPGGSSSEPMPPLLNQGANRRTAPSRRDASVRPVSAYQMLPSVPAKNPVGSSPYRPRMQPTLTQPVEYRSSNGSWQGANPTPRK